MDKQQIIEQLKDDEQYYGEYGQQFLSNSDVKVLRTDYKSFRSKKKFTDEQMKNLELGRYFHQLLLEEEKAKSFPMIDVKTRASKDYKQYKEDNNVDFILRTSEAQEIKDLADWVMNDNTLYGTSVVRDLINNPMALKEQPSIMELHGHWWKGKADLITIDNDGQYVIIDLKTTSTNPSEITKWTLDSFGYNSQAYLYKELYGMNFKFIFFGKKQKINDSGEIYYDVEEITPSEDTLEMGKMRVMEALANYERWYAEGSTENVRETYISRVI